MELSILRYTTMVLGTLRKLWSQHHFQIPQHFLYSQINDASVTSHSPSPIQLNHWQTLIYFVSLWIDISWTFHTTESRSMPPLSLAFNLSEFSQDLHVITGISALLIFMIG